MPEYFRLEVLPTFNNGEWEFFDEARRITTLVAAAMEEHKRDKRQYRILNMHGVELWKVPNQ